MLACLALCLFSFLTMANLSSPMPTGFSMPAFSF